MDAYWLTILLALLFLSSAWVTLSIPTRLEDPQDPEWTPRDIQAIETTFKRRRLYFGVTTALMLGAVIASWQRNMRWTAGLGGSVAVSILAYALGVHQVLEVGSRSK